MKRIVTCTTIGSFGLIAALLLTACSGATTDPDQRCEDTTPNQNTYLDAGHDGGDDTGLEHEDSPLWQGLVINEIAATGEPEDWFELFNQSDQPIDLTGYYFTDDIEDQPQRGTFPENTIIESQGYVLFYMDDDWPGFKLSGDEELAIYSPQIELIDSVDWEDGQSPADKSFGRIPNGMGSFQTLNYPTPGSENVSNSLLGTCGTQEAGLGQLCDGEDLNGHGCQDFGFIGGTITCNDDCNSFDVSLCERAEDNIVINEVTSQGDDEIELFNRGSVDVDISDWYVTDDEPEVDGHHFYFAQGTVLEAGQYLVLVKGDDHLFGLGADDYVALYTDEGEIVDIVAWKNHDAAISLCRIPDGTGPFQQCAEPTFGEPN